MDSCITPTITLEVEIKTQSYLLSWKREREWGGERERERIKSPRIKSNDDNNRLQTHTHTQVESNFLALPSQMTGLILDTKQLFWKMIEGSVHKCLHRDLIPAQLKMAAKVDRILPIHFLWLQGPNFCSCLPEEESCRQKQHKYFWVAELSSAMLRQLELREGLQQERTTQTSRRRFEKDFKGSMFKEKKNTTTKCSGNHYMWRSHQSTKKTTGWQLWWKPFQSCHGSSCCNSPTQSSVRLGFFF